MKPSSAKAKGSRLERESAAMIGGKRSPLSGAVGGGDIWLPSDSIFADWSWEAKARAKLPAYFTAAMSQAEIECRGTNKRPAIIMKEDRGVIMFASRLDDFVQWSKALSEVGQGSSIRATINQAQRLLDQAKEMAR